MKLLHALTGCAIALLGSLLLAQTNSAAATGNGDPVKGKQIFEKRCSGCHSMEQDREGREGPRLHGVFGGRSGEVPGFPYSDALKNAHILWDEKSLDQWLTDPDTLVPGNNMGFHVAQHDERRDLIRFLRQISADAVQIKPTAITRNG
jgi:cytochrome c